VSDNFNTSTVLRAWQVAKQPRQFTEMLVHTFNLPNPDALDFLLDSLSVAKQTGRIRVLHAMPDLFTPSSSIQTRSSIGAPLSR